MCLAIKGSQCSRSSSSVASTLSSSRKLVLLSLNRWYLLLRWGEMKYWEISENYVSFSIAWSGRCKRLATPPAPLYFEKYVRTLIWEIDFPTIKVSRILVTKNCNLLGPRFRRDQDVFRAIPILNCSESLFPSFCTLIPHNFLLAPLLAQSHP